MSDQELRQQIADLTNAVEDLENRVTELEPVAKWYSELQTTTKATKIAFAAVGALLGLIISILTIINLWPGPAG